MSADIVNQLPYPAALILKRMLDAADSRQSPFDRVSHLFRAVEVWMKVLAAYGLGLYLHWPGRTRQRDDTLLDVLVRPTMGMWCGLLKSLSHDIKAEPSPGRDLFNMLFAERGNKRFATAHLKFIEDAVGLRNRRYHSTAHPAESQCAQDYQEGSARFINVLATAKWISGFPFIRPTSTCAAELWMGPEPGVAQVSGEFPPGSVGRLGFLAPGPPPKFVDLAPFIMPPARGEDAGKGAKVWLYESIGRWRAERKEVKMDDMVSAEPISSRAPAQELERRFKPEVLNRAFNKRKVSIEDYLRNFGHIHELHANLVGREFVFEVIDEFTQARKSGVFLLVAEPGMGKTAIMSNLARRGDGAAHFFYTATSGLTSPDDCVKCLYQCLLNRWGWADDSPTQNSKELRAKLENLLGRISASLKPGEKELIVIDALDEAAYAFDGATACSVLPQAMPEGTYLILSSRRNNPDLRRLAKRPDLREFTLRSESEDNRADAEEYLRYRLGDRLDEEARRTIAERAEWNFLVLKLVCDTVSKHDFSRDRLEELFRGGGKLGDFYHEWWERVARRCSDDRVRWNLVHSVIAALATSCSPVTAAQICRVITMKMEEFDWAFRFMGQYLDVSVALESDTAESHEKTITSYQIFHKSFQDFIREKLLRELAPYHTQWAESLRNWRHLQGHEREYALRHLPEHFTKAGKWDDLANLLTDIDFLEGKAGAGMVTELAEDFWESLKMPPTHSRRKILPLLEEAMRANLPLIEVSPETIFPILYNQCYWYDSPEAANHYEKPESGWATPPPWEQVGDKLCTLMEQWRARKEVAPLSPSGGAPGPPKTHLGATLVAISEFEWPRKGLSISPDGKYVGVLDNSLTLYLWECETNRVRALWELKSLPTNSSMLDGSCQIAFSPGAKHIAIPCEDRLDVLDTITGQNVLCIGQMAKPISVAFSPDGQRIASGGSDGTLWVWDTMKGEKVASYKSNEEGELTSLCFCHDGDIIAAGCERGVILLFDATTGKQLLCLRGHTGSVICLTFSPDRRCLASADITYGSDETVRLWDLQRGREIYYLPIFATSLEFSPDGKRIVIAAGGACEVQMWGTEIPQQSGCIKLEYFTCASFSSYGNSIVLGELGNRVLVRDLRRVLPIIASRKMQGGGLL